MNTADMAAVLAVLTTAIIAAQAAVLMALLALIHDDIAPAVQPAGFTTCLFAVIAGWALGVFRSPIEIKATPRP